YTITNVKRSRDVRVVRIKGRSKWTNENVIAIIVGKVDRFNIKFADSLNVLIEERELLFVKYKKHAEPKVRNRTITNRKAEIMTEKIITIKILFCLNH